MRQRLHCNPGDQQGQEITGAEVSKHVQPTLTCNVHCTCASLRQHFIQKTSKVRKSQPGRNNNFNETTLYLGDEQGQKILAADVTKHVCFIDTTL